MPQGPVQRNIAETAKLIMTDDAPVRADELQNLQQSLHWTLDSDAADDNYMRVIVIPSIEETTV